MENDIAIGIDLGTSNSLVAVFRDGRVEIIENEFGTFTTPSYVAFSQHEKLIGKLAKNLVVDEPENTAYGVKRWIGTKLDDHWTQDKIGQTFNLHKNCEMTRIMFREFGPKEISAMILKRLKEMAENYLEARVTKAVISVPANFNNSQRQATIEAGTIAGLKVLDIINEPTAAALCYGMKKKLSPINKTVLIFDLGGGTFDVSVISINDGKFTVRSTAGDCHLGGNDFDKALVNHCLDSFKAQHGLDPSIDKCAMQRLRVECEQAKIRLSTSNHTTIKVDYLFKQRHFSLTIDRTKFEDLCRKHFNCIMFIVNDVASRAKCLIEDIVLVGGSTRIPIIRQLLQRYFSLEKTKYNLVNPDQAVVNGAAIHAAILNRQNNCPNFSLFNDVCSTSFDCYAGDGKSIDIVQPNTPIPNQIESIDIVQPNTPIPNQIESIDIVQPNTPIPNQIESIDIVQPNTPIPNQIESIDIVQPNTPIPNQIESIDIVQPNTPIPNQIESIDIVQPNTPIPNQIESIDIVQPNTPIPNQIESIDIVQPNTPIPNQIESIDIVHGAAIKANILTNQDDCEAIRKLKICDVTQLSLGVQVADKQMCTVVNRNTPIPTTKEQILATSEDNQTCVSFSSFEGEKREIRATE